MFYDVVLGSWAELSVCHPSRHCLKWMRSSPQAACASYHKCQESESRRINLSAFNRDIIGSAAIQLRNVGCSPKHWEIGRQFSLPVFDSRSVTSARSNHIHHFSIRSPSAYRAPLLWLLQYEGFLRSHKEYENRQEVSWNSVIGYYLLESFTLQCSPFIQIHRRE